MIFEVDLKHVPTIVEEQVIVDPPVTPPVVSESGPRRLIICSDWWTDVDDAVAMRLAAWAERVGMIDLVAITLSASDYFSAPSLDEMLNNDGISDMVIGKGRYVSHGGTPSYQRTMMENYTEGAYSTTSECESAIRVMRRALVDSDKKTDISIIGFMTNYSDLLKSGPDDISDLTGYDLVTQKVDTVWITGGKYPNPGGGLAEYNFRGDPEATKYVCENSPVRLVFHGYGEGYFVKTGQTLNINSGGTPVPRYSDDILAQAMVDHGTWELGNNSWDPLSIMVAAHGDPYRYGYSIDYGYNTIDEETGYNQWTSTGDPNDDIHKEVNRFELGTGNSDPTMWEYDMNPILERDGGFYSWPAVRDDLGSERLAKLPRNNSATDDANMVANWSIDRFFDYPDGTSIYKVNDLSAANTSLVRRIVPEAPLKGEINGSRSLNFHGLTGARKLVTKNNFQIQTESTFYIRVLFEEAVTTTQSILTQASLADAVFHIKINSNGTLGAYRWSSYGNSGAKGVNMPVTVVPNTWHTIAVRFVEIGGVGYIEAFFDGTKDPTTGSVLYGGNYTVANQPVCVGNRYNDVGNSEQFYGHISDLRIYNGAHNDSTVSQVLSELG